jgi:uncharacterized membrane protein YkvA (DUF1232 family)
LTGRLPQIVAHLPQFARLYWRLFRDPRVGLLAKTWLVLVALYVVSPIDLIPAWLPLIGQADDLLVVLGGLWLFVRLCPPVVVREHVARIAAGRAAR